MDPRTDGRGFTSLAHERGLTLREYPSTPVHAMSQRLGLFSWQKRALGGILGQAARLCQQMVSGRAQGQPAKTRERFRDDSAKPKMCKSVMSCKGCRAAV